jgi:hypothetical protein
MYPLAKSFVKGGILAYDKARESAAESGEPLGDLMAEARPEMPSSAARSSGPCFVHDASPLAEHGEIATGVVRVTPT